MKRGSFWEILNILINNYCHNFATRNTTNFIPQNSTIASIIHSLAELSKCHITSISSKLPRPFSMYNLIEGNFYLNINIVVWSLFSIMLHYTTQSSGIRHIYLFNLNSQNAPIKISKIKGWNLRHFFPLFYTIRSYMLIVRFLHTKKGVKI